MYMCYIRLNIEINGVYTKPIIIMMMKSRICYQTFFIINNYFISFFKGTTSHFKITNYFKFTFNTKSIYYFITLIPPPIEKKVI